jgi:hypothetical protein
MIEIVQGAGMTLVALLMLGHRLFLAIKPEAYRKRILSDLERKSVSPSGYDRFLARWSSGKRMDATGYREIGIFAIVIGALWLYVGIGILIGPR